MLFLRRDDRVRSRITVEVRKRARPPQRATIAGTMRVDGLAPGLGVLFIQQLVHWDGVEIRVAEKERAVQESTPICLHEQVNALNGVESGLADVEPFQDVECLDQRDAPR